MKNKPAQILDILRSTDYSETEKKIVFIKWKFNQMPLLYRQQNQEQILKEIANIQSS